MSQAALSLLFPHHLQLILLSCVMEPVKTAREGLSSEKDLGMSTDRVWKTPTMAFPAPTTTTWSLSMEALTPVSLGGNPAVSFVAALSTTAQRGLHPATCPASLVSVGHRLCPWGLPRHSHPGRAAPGLEQALFLARVSQAWRHQHCLAARPIFPLWLG